MHPDEPMTYFRPADVPTTLTSYERAIIAARNVRAWADWLLDTGPAPPQSDKLIDVGEGGETQ